MMAFAGMVGESLAQAGATESDDGAIALGQTHHAPKAKRIIFLYMNGGLSQVDSFDPKPMLDKYDGQPLPGGSVATERKTGALMQSPFAFKKYGQCGMEVSELFPFVGECADDICFVRSIYTDIPNHEPSMLMMNTGNSQVGRPSMGAWLTYGLGTENKNLPGFVVLCPDVPTTVGPPLWNNAFLPAVHQGTYISDKVEKQTADDLIGKKFDPKELIPYIHNDKFTGPEQRRELDLLEKLNRLRQPERDPQLEAAVQSMEIAYRMQTEAPEVFDIRKESAATLKLYGEGSTARGCLMGVRLAEKRRAHGADLLRQRRSVGRAQRHSGAPQECARFRSAVRGGDQGPEDARVAEGHASCMRIGIRPDACARNRRRRRCDRTGAITIRSGSPCGWPAAAIKGGMIYGATDDFGFKAVDKPVHVHDLHATILHLMGIDHTRLTYRYSGRDFRLTDVSGNVIHDIIG